MVVLKPLYAHVENEFHANLDEFLCDGAFDGTVELHLFGFVSTTFVQGIHTVL